MPPSTKKKVTLYFNAPMLAETQKEAIRQDRSISWIIQAAWRRARDEIRRLPAVGRTDLPEMPEDPSAPSADSTKSE
ncbi:MAG: TIGR04563 family protein [Deltaproteobacteria bacterium]|nr:TIGR04563 family protein [Deltaproteobacteria bacterium]